MKAAPVIRALEEYSQVRQVLVHTGQHYDSSMSETFFQQLGLPAPAINLNVGSGTHAQQTATIMSRFEPVIQDQCPDWVIVYGDVNSTVATALVCAKLLIPVAHVEAGLRSHDRTMPEEINRLLTDQISDLLFTSSLEDNANLLQEGIASQKIIHVGNTMIDTLIRFLPQLNEGSTLGRLGLSVGQAFVLVTLHRPSNVDNREQLSAIMAVLADLSKDLPIVFPVHPRTRDRLKQWNIATADMQITSPLTYFDFLALQKCAELVITDSGGVQEETTFLGVPCLTVRSNTERPVTVEIGTNIVVGSDVTHLRHEILRVLAGDKKTGTVPSLWDGHAGERIASTFNLV